MLRNYIYLATAALVYTFCGHKTASIAFLSIWHGSLLVTFQSHSFINDSFSRILFSSI